MQISVVPYSCISAFAVFHKTVLPYLCIPALAGSCIPATLGLCKCTFLHPCICIVLHLRLYSDMIASRPPHIITIASSKGGVGKSTICISLAGAMAAAGQSVHIIDLDENKTVLRWHTQHQVRIPNLSVSSAAAADFSAHFKAVANERYEMILIDLAGVYEKALLHAMARSSLVIIPAQPSEPDIHEATKIIRDLTDLNDSFQGNVPYRILLNLFDPLDPLYQRHVVDEIGRLGLHCGASCTNGLLTARPSSMACRRIKPMSPVSRSARPCKRSTGCLAKSRPS